jgi:hypothetical protein
LTFGGRPKGHENFDAAFFAAAATTRGGAGSRERERDAFFVAFFVAFLTAAAAARERTGSRERELRAFFAAFFDPRWVKSFLRGLAAGVFACGPFTAGFFAGRLEPRATSARRLPMMFALCHDPIPDEHGIGTRAKVQGGRERREGSSRPALWGWTVEDRLKWTC